MGSCLFSSENDALFENSTSNYIFPRTAVAAGSFWRWDRRVDASSSAFAAAFDTMQLRLRARGVTTCPCTTLTSNACDQNAYCGEPYCSSGANWTCKDYADDGQWSCHTARTGLFLISRHHHREPSSPITLIPHTPKYMSAPPSWYTP